MSSNTKAEEIMAAARKKKAAETPVDNSDLDALLGEINGTTSEPSPPTLEEIVHGPAVTEEGPAIPFTTTIEDASDVVAVEAPAVVAKEAPEAQPEALNAVPGETRFKSRTEAELARGRQALADKAKGVVRRTASE